MRFDAAGQLAVRADAELAREVKDIADAHGVGEWQSLAVHARPAEMLDGGPWRSGASSAGHGENSGCECDDVFHGPSRHPASSRGLPAFEAVEGRRIPGQ